MKDLLGIFVSLQWVPLRSALATMEYIFAAIDSYESGGQLVRPHALPAYHGDPTIIH